MGTMEDHPDLSPFARHLHKKIDESGKTQREIAKAAGFKSPNILSMIKHQETGIPLRRIIPLAKALDDDPALLLRLALAEFWPDHKEVIDEIVGGIISRNEMDLVRSFRAATRDQDPAFDAGALSTLWRGVLSWAWLRDLLMPPRASAAGVSSGSR